jgi:predicted enzyme related to lactoylglutathione lyase
MKIGFVRVFVTDFSKSLEFYTNALEMTLDYTDNKAWAQFKSGADVSLAIEACAIDHIEFGSRVVGRFCGVTFMVDEITSTYERLRNKGVEFLSEPQTQPWGGTLAHFKDLDSNVLTLLQEGAS